MIPVEFQYKRANTVEEALELMQEHGSDAKILAGGHSLIPAMKLRLNDPGVLIDISHIDILGGIDDDPDDVVIKAGTTHAEIAASSIINQHLPVMAEAASLIGDPMVRNRGTIGGSLAHSDPAADWPAVVLALNGQIHLYSNEGIRFVEADEFFTGMFSTALQANELIMSIRFPKANAGCRSAYRKFSQPASRYAIVGAAVCLTSEGGVCKNARVAFNGLSTHAFRDSAVEQALVGKELNAENIRAAANLAGENAYVMSDHFASEEYRLHLAKVFAKRAIEAAC